MAMHAGNGPKSRQDAAPTEPSVPHEPEPIGDPAVTRERDLICEHQLTLLRSVRDKLVVAAQRKFEAARHTVDEAPAVADGALRQADTVLVALRHAVHLVDHERSRQRGTSSHT